MALHGIALDHMISTLDGIGIKWHFMYGIAWYFMMLHCIIWYYIVSY